MLKQILALDLMLDKAELQKGYDYSYNQYVEKLKSKINITVDEKFFNLFCRRFYEYFNTCDTVFDDIDLFFEALNTDAEIYLPMYEKLYMAVMNINSEDLKVNDTMHTVQNGNQSSSAEAYSAQFPEQLVNHKSLEYATDGSISSGSGKSEQVTDVTSATGSRLDNMEKLIESQKNIINECIYKFKHLFVLIY